MNLFKARQPRQKQSLRNRKWFALQPVRIITKADELVGKPFRELGEVSGESCQATNQDSPPNIPTARKRMQINAAKMKANAVLLHSCEVTSGTPGCYRQAVCIGSALNITAK